MISPAGTVGNGSPAQDRTPVPAEKGAGPLLDLRGLRCPLPVLKTARHLAALAPGAVLTVLADDPLAAIDLPLFCRQEAQELLEQDRIEDGAARFRIRRAERAPRLGEV